MPLVSASFITMFSTGILVQLSIKQKEIQRRFWTFLDEKYLRNLKSVMKQRGETISVILFCVGMYLRKTGIPAGGFLFLFFGLLLALFLVLNGIRRIKEQSVKEKKFRFPVEFYLAFAELILVARLQYWLDPNWVWIALLLLVIVLFLLTRSKNFTGPGLCTKIRHNPVRIFLLLLLLTLSIFSLSVNPRKFHNAFRPTFYEEYTRSKFPDSLQTAADLLIEKYKCQTADCIVSAEQLSLMASEKDSSRDYDESLKLINEAVDLAPDEAKYYYQRGHLKLIKMDLNEERVRSSVIDFNRAIELKPDYAYAYYFRGVALAYLDRKDKVCPDMKKAKALDPALPIKDYVNKFCPDSDSTALEQLHP